MTISTIFIPSLHKNVTKHEILRVIEHEYNIGVIDGIEILNKSSEIDDIKYKMAYIHLTFNTENLVAQKIIETFQDRDTYYLHVTKYSDYEDRYETTWSLVESLIQNNSYQKIRTNIPITPT
jgi:hypothetical protein